MNETTTSDAAPDDGTLCTGVVTVSARRSLATDGAGEAITTALEDDGNEVTVREHVGADHDKVQSIVSRLIDRNDVDIVITAGATSVEPTDVTLDAVEPLLEKELPTFSELFTFLAYDRVGTKTVAVRTLAGVADGTPVFCLPGNADAVRLALEEIILSEASVLVELAREEPAEDDDSTDGDAADGGA
ncbi:MogA/MoaB family molybdenum cofactor biosynthesis protein [Natrinema gari]|uniref:Molybdopterin binding domain protein n=1 Tax=Natrinema gari JCM 14663 TaxID=1230459 RepID=L9Z1Y8_9EURY|nr:molybdopterin-binding protein [Natrinema gari]ELY79926.1 molybdopterin binding domain protein [Natrinema gari JCM 14663]